MERTFARLLSRGLDVDLPIGSQHSKDDPVCAFLLKYPDIFLHDLDLGF